MDHAIHAIDYLKLNQLYEKVYTWMFFGLILSAFTAFTVSYSKVFQIVIFKSWVMMTLIIVELILVFALSMAINKISDHTAKIMFVLYSLLNGLTLSVILFIYTSTSIVTAFMLTAILFGIMAYYGYSTKRDLSSWGSILLMIIIGIILAGIINIFLKSSMMNFIINIITVVVFSLLTAYDNYKIRKAVEYNGLRNEEEINKLGIIFALSLYIDFINIFLSLLNLTGKERD